MKILQAAQFYPPVVGGEERHVRNLALALTERHEVGVITFGQQNSAEVRDGVTVHSIRPTAASLPFVYQDVERMHAPPVPDPGVVRAIARIVEQEQPDVIHAHNWIVNSVLAAQRGHGQVPVVLTLHDYSLVCATKRYMYLDERECEGPNALRCLRCTRRRYQGPVGALVYAGNAVTRRSRLDGLARVLAVSSAVADRNRLADSDVPFEVVPNFVPNSLAGTSHPPAPGFDPGGYLLFVGDLSRDKGVDVALDAYASLPARRPRLVLVGRRTPDTPDDVPAGATVLDSAEHALVMRLMAHAVAVLAPSVWPDPCPTVVLEAMAAGRCVLTTCTGGMVDMIEDGVHGRLLPPGDAAELAAAIQDVLSRPASAESMGAAAKIRVGAFTAAHVVPRIERVYHDVAHVPFAVPPARPIPTGVGGTYHAEAGP